MVTNAPADKDPHIHGRYRIGYKLVVRPTDFRTICVRQVLRTPAGPLVKELVEREEVKATWTEEQFRLLMDGWGYEHVVDRFVKDNDIQFKEVE
jgi:hypothetical protein